MSGNKLFVSQNIVLEDSFLNGGILVDVDGKICKIIKHEDLEDYYSEGAEVIDVGDLFFMYGVIDSHVHVNEPGRTEWEGFNTATAAAAAGGITTIVDMPLNSIPPTTTVENFHKKLEVAHNQLHVDAAFWGGLVKGNKNELLRLVDAGVVGFKCFMCPSGVDEFPCVDANDIKEALEVLEQTDTVLAFHAEVEENIEITGDDFHDYNTFLKSRPPSMEVNAIKTIVELSEKHNVRTHVVHLSAAEALPAIQKVKNKGVQLTVETCHHYLNLESENISNGATQFKCCPPVRSSENKERLWQGLKNSIIDMVVSDHSPCTPDLKLLNTPSGGDFIKAWGGIASVQFGLSLFWTSAKIRGFSIFAINKYMSRAPAQLIGLHNVKGKISPGFDADFVIWDPQAIIKIDESVILHKNKITPYVGKELQGKVYKTYVRGQNVFDCATGLRIPPAGKIVLK